MNPNDLPGAFALLTRSEASRPFRLNWGGVGDVHRSHHTLGWVLISQRLDVNGGLCTGIEGHVPIIARGFAARGLYRPASWRTTGHRPGRAASDQWDVTHARAGDSWADYQRLSRARIVAHEMNAARIDGAGSVRDLAVGHWFGLSDYPELD
ncbi:contractile injection system protein, VgrG/Pvc8 family [Paraburkholderia caffeinilytica]|uniref:contractile injection system protein, VgrG/Pvc8 family n=1 Tax=Paraburkholderia caffeinilytica TaxID=1761016 RepID=UPI003DA1612F